jgi:hypothetical protein
MEGREERVRLRAHEIWEREGRPEGQDEAHRERALRELEAEDAVKARVSVQEPIEPPGRERPER